ncbi:MAG: L,D-transpeptidase family protein [Chloroflexi bacterium]|nr:L,D-transpeptidase family protein [Chloroflexota bacterium]
MANSKRPPITVQIRRSPAVDENYAGQYQYVRIPSRRYEIPTWFVAVVIAFLVTACLMPFLLSLGYYAYYQFSEKIIPGVKVGDLDLSNVGVRNAAAELGAYYNLKRTITVSNGFKTWEVTPAQLGLKINIGATIDDAFSVGRYQGVNENINQMLTSFWDGWQVPPVISFDEETARAGLETIAAEAGKPATDASISLQNGEWVTTPSEIGYAVNIEETLAALKSNPSKVMASGYFQLNIIPVAPQVNDALAVKEQAQKFLEKNVEIKAYDPITNEFITWNVSKEMLGTWLKAEANPQGVSVGIEPNQVTAYLKSMSDTLGNDRWLDAEKYSHGLAQAISQGTPYYVIINHKPTSYTIQKGDTLLKISWKTGFPMWYLLNANPNLNADTLVVGETITIPSKDEMLPLPVIPNKRIVLNITKQRMMIYENGEQIKKFVMSTGIDKSPTQPGVFQVQSHKINAYASEWDLYMPNFLGIYEAWPGFMNGIHGLPMLSNGTRLWANVLGKPASYGCIILDLDDAKWLYKWADDGVVVEIRP